MSYASRRALLGVASVLVLACMLPGCSGGSDDSTSKTVGTAGTTPAPIAVRISSLSITVENHADQPLRDVRVAIRPVGRTVPFTATIPRLEPGERRELSLGDFLAGDKTRFNTFAPPPKEVAVTAEDVLGRHYETTVSWKRK